MVCAQSCGYLDKHLFASHKFERNGAFPLSRIVFADFGNGLVHEALVVGVHVVERSLGSGLVGEFRDIH